MNLEERFAKHLEESGEIKTDLSWIKKAIWVTVAAGGTTAAGMVVQLFLMLVKG